MSVFTYALDLACLQAFAMYNIIWAADEKVTLLQFKRKLCETLIEPYIFERKRGKIQQFPVMQTLSLEQLTINTC